jgi:hypothetical protein
MRKLLSKNKKPAAKDYEKIITIQEQIIKTYEARTIWAEEQYLELFYDALELKKELELAYKDRNEAIRRYNALHQLGQLAENMGIDLTQKLPEHEFKKWKDHKFDIKTRVLESGKTTFTASLKKNLSQQQQDFPRLHNKGKKKK